MICTPIGRPVFVNAAVDRDRRLLGEIPRHREADVLERVFGIVARGGALRGKRRDRRGRRNKIVDLAEQQRRKPAQLHALVEAADDIGAGELCATLGPLARVGMNFGALLGWQQLDVAPGSRAEERVQPVEDGARYDALAPARRPRLRRRNAFRDVLDRRLHLRIDRHADACIEQQADAFSLEQARQVRPIDVLHRQAHAVAMVGLRQQRHHQRGVVDRAGHRAGAARHVRRVDRDAAEARLQSDQPAPAGRQAHRAADIGADVKRPVAGRARRARTGARSARDSSTGPTDCA